MTFNLNKKRVGSTKLRFSVSLKHRPKICFQFFFFFFQQKTEDKCQSNISLMGPTLKKKKHPNQIGLLPIIGTKMSQLPSTLPHQCQKINWIRNKIISNLFIFLKK